MSLQALQSAFGFLVSGESPARASGRAGLTRREQAQVDDVAAQPGLATVRMLYQSWRLTKVLTLAPLTTEMLGEQSAVLLTEFWRARPARGPYFVEECRAFLEFVDDRRSQFDLPCLADVLAFERTRLEMHDAVTRGAEHVTGQVLFQHDPAVVIRAAREGARVEPPIRPTVLRGELWRDGGERWTVDDHEPNRPPAEVVV